ncbi:MAG: hypothetical protein H0X23_02075 [Rubrobacter sp.]|nr:hypothetical protein [Rubrobacter sp.]
MSAAPSTLRISTELMLPGILVGLGTGLIAGGLAALGGLPFAYVALTTLALGVPLAVMGAGYDAILASGRIRLGGVAPAMLYWIPAFPLARLFHEVVLDIGFGRAVVLPEALMSFLTFQAIMSVGYTIGFLWLHENVAGLWWLRVRDHNPVAARYVGQYTSQAAVMQGSKEQKARPNDGVGTSKPK